MCPLVSVCPSQGIYQPNYVDVNVSVATQEKNPIGCQRDVRKIIHAFLSMNTMDNQFIIVTQVIVIQVITKLSYLCIAFFYPNYYSRKWETE